MPVTLSHPLQPVPGLNFAPPTFPGMPDGYWETGGWDWEWNCLWHLLPMSSLAPVSLLPSQGLTSKSGQWTSMGRRSSCRSGKWGGGVGVELGTPPASH